MLLPRARLRPRLPQTTTCIRQLFAPSKVAATGKAVVHPNFFVSGLILVLTLSSVSTVQAQVTMDASKITCDQFVHSKVAPTRIVAAWLSGFYNGKRDNRVIDLQSFEANLSKLENFCYEEKNYKLPVMQAVEQVIGRGK
jgi:acid stress chaperone HdeB